MRSFVIAIAALVALTIASDAVNAQKGKGVTPPQVEGPFYPDKLPADTDNDLVFVNGSSQKANGVVTHLSGKVVGKNGKPIQNAVVEIWQVCGNGSYIHSRSFSREKLDPNFQGFGRCMTDEKGRYYFRTIKPIPYVGRCPHIHFIVKHEGKRLLTTQIYIKGHPQNQKDFLFRKVRNNRDSVVVNFAPIKGQKNQARARFDIVLGVTPELIDND